MKSPKRGNMSQIRQNLQGEINRDRIMETIRLHPGIVMAGIVEKTGTTKSNAYQHVAILISSGRAKPIAFAGKVGTRGSSVGYWPTVEGDEQLELTGRFDYPTQIIVPATDNAKLPKMDELTACLFGRATKETA